MWTSEVCFGLIVCFNYLYTPNSTLTPLSRQCIVVYCKFMQKVFIALGLIVDAFSAMLVGLVGE